MAHPNPARWPPAPGCGARGTPWSEGSCLPGTGPGAQPFPGSRRVLPGLCRALTSHPGRHYPAGSYPGQALPGHVQSSSPSQPARPPGPDLPGRPGGPGEPGQLPGRTTDRPASCEPARAQSPRPGRRTRPGDLRPGVRTGGMPGPARRPAPLQGERSPGAASKAGPASGGVRHHCRALPDGTPCRRPSRAVPGCPSVHGPLTAVSGQPPAQTGVPARAGHIQSPNRPEPVTNRIQSFSSAWHGVTPRCREVKRR